MYAAAFLECRLQGWSKYDEYRHIKSPHEDNTHSQT